jgi:hypothetical protein
VLLSWLHWSPRVLAPSVTVLLLVAGPLVVLLVGLVAPGILLAVGHLVALAPILGRLVDGHGSFME